MCHNAEFHEISCGHIVISWFCLTGGHLGFLKLDFLTYGAVKSPILYRPAKFRKSNQWEDIAVFRFFQYGGCLPSRIWLMHIWTTHDEYLVVFIAVQNLVGIVAVVIIGKFNILHLWLENANLCPQKLRFGWFHPLNGDCQCRLSHQAWKSVDVFDLYPKSV